MHRSRVLGLFLSLIMLAVASLAPLTVASAHGTSKKDNCKNKCHSGSRITQAQKETMMKAFGGMKKQRRKDPSNTYNVTIQGTISGSTPFMKKGMLVISFPPPPNSSNMFNICLNTNVPGGMSGMGDITLNSQQSCSAPGGTSTSGADLGSITPDPSTNTATLHVNPDPITALTGGNFIAGFGPAGTIVSGDMTLHFSDDFTSFSGEIHVGANTPFNFAEQNIPYDATITGTFVNSHN